MQGQASVYQIFAEIARLYNSDYLVKCHRSRVDSGLGEAERTNSAIGDAVVDGGTVEWEVIRDAEIAQHNRRN